MHARRVIAARYSSLGLAYLSIAYYVSRRKRAGFGMVPGVSRLLWPLLPKAKVRI